MKCPHCGRWNRASLPRCFYCGETLTEAEDAARQEEQRPSVPVEGPSKVYIQYTEEGQSTPAVDERDQLAAEMKDLLARKRRGEIQHRRLRENSARQGFAPTGRTAQTLSGRSPFPYPDAYPEGEEREVGGSVREDAIPVQSRRVIGYDDDQRAHTGVNPVEGGRGKRGNIYRRPGKRRFIRVFLILALLAGAAAAAYQWLYLPSLNKAQQESILGRVEITPSILNDMPAHIIRLPGEEGQIYWIGGKIKNSYMVVGGYATIEVADYVWYEDQTTITEETATATIIPYLRTNAGEQKQMDTISFAVDIPESPLDLVNPTTSDRVEVSTQLYAIEFDVVKGSTVLINGQDYSDLVNTQNGRITLNATIQPIGDNVFNISVRAPYCREATKQVIIYRKEQQIRLDLSPDIATRYTPNLVDDTSQPKNEKGQYPKIEPRMEVKGSTVTWADIKVLTPYVDLDLTRLRVDGTFSFRAVFDRIGYNTIVIEASAPGYETSRVEHEVYYMPVADIYTRKAWDMNTQYTDYLNRSETRINNTQIYQCIGEIIQILSDNPQMAIMKLDSDYERTVLLRNYTYDIWMVGKRYKIFGDAYGVYNGAPWLNGRYSYILQ